MNRFLRCAAVAATLAFLGGCVVAPAPYGPPYGYAYAPAYAYAPYPVVGVGACFGCGHFHRW
jgi:hypothetical protein